MAQLLNSYPSHGVFPNIYGYRGPFIFLDKHEARMEFLGEPRATRLTREFPRNVEKFCTGKPKEIHTVNGQMRLGQKVLMTNGPTIQRARTDTAYISRTLDKFLKNQYTDQERMTICRNSNDGKIWADDLDLFYGEISEQIIEKRILPQMKHQYPFTCPNLQLYFELRVSTDEDAFFAHFTKVISNIFSNPIEGWDSMKSEVQFRESFRAWKVPIRNNKRRNFESKIRLYRKGDYYRCEMELKNPIIDGNVGRWDRQEQYYCSKFLFELLRVGDVMDKQLRRIHEALQYQQPKINVGLFQRLLAECGVKNVYHDGRIKELIKDLEADGSYTPALRKNQADKLDSGVLEKAERFGMVEKFKGAAFNGDGRKVSYRLTKNWWSPKTSKIKGRASFKKLLEHSEVWH